MMNWMFGSRAMGTPGADVEVSGWMAVVGNMKKLVAHLDSDPDHPIT